MKLLLSMIQPSQLYINRAKLDKVLTIINEEGFEALEPVPIKELNTEMVMTDGHTRAFAHFLLGRKEINVVWEEDELNWEMYRFCVYWCNAYEIYSIDHLDGRIVSNEDYQRLWIDQCQLAKQELAKLDDMGNFD